jgi:hypothetical protein
VKEGRAEFRRISLRTPGYHARRRGSGPTSDPAIFKVCGTVDYLG